MTTPEEKLRELRDGLAALGELFVRLGKKERSVKFCCTAVSYDIGETLLEMDTRMGWDDE